MDINEVSDKIIHRHPWELSRTQSIFREIHPILCRMNGNVDFLSVGAGDMFFDKHILQFMKNHTLYAVDIGYDTDKIELVRTRSARIKMFSNMESLGNKEFDYALMLDSLEYMPDDREFLKTLRDRVRSGGYLIFTLPAFSIMFSKHDEIVGNLRRYSIRDFKGLVKCVGGIELISSHYFYNSLFIIRLVEKLLKVNIDPEHKVTTGWKYGRKNIVTRVVVRILNLDYFVCMSMSKIGLFIPGLSMIAVCRKL